jgi:hypothetical protein
MCPENLFSQLGSQTLYFAPWHRRFCPSAQSMKTSKQRTSTHDRDPAVAPQQPHLHGAVSSAHQVQGSAPWPQIARYAACDVVHSYQFRRCGRTTMDHPANPRAPYLGHRSQIPLFHQCDHFCICRKTLKRFCPGRQIRVATIEMQITRAVTCNNLDHADLCAVTGHNSGCANYSGFCHIGLTSNRCHSPYRFGNLSKQSLC